SPPRHPSAREWDNGQQRHLAIEAFAPRQLISIKAIPGKVRSGFPPGDCDKETNPRKSAKRFSARGLRQETNPGKSVKRFSVRDCDKETIPRRTRRLTLDESQKQRPPRF